MTKIYRGIDRMNLTDELDLCGDVNILSNKNNLLKICELLGLKPKLTMRYPIKVGMWWIGK